MTITSFLFIHALMVVFVYIHLMEMSSARPDDGNLMAPPSPTPSGPMHVGGLNGIQEESECADMPSHGGSDRLGAVRDISPSGGVRVVSDLLGPSPPPPPPTLLNGHSAMNGRYIIEMYNGNCDNSMRIIHLQIDPSWEM